MADTEAPPINREVLITGWIGRRAWTQEIVGLWNGRQWIGIHGEAVIGVDCWREFDATTLPVRTL
jgi:hypothetical protein